MNRILPPLTKPRKPSPSIDWVAIFVLAGICLVVYLLAIVLYHERWVPAAGMVTVLGIIWWQICRRPLYLIGPLFYYETIRLARKGRTTFLRCLYGLALLVVLWFTYEAWVRSQGYYHRETPDLLYTRLGQLAENFSLTILVVQNVAVLLLTPLYLSSCIQDERHRGTLEMLFGTHLHDNEIIVGKMLARVAMIGLLVLTGVPVLGLIQFWGGVNPYLVVGGFFLTAITLFHAGSISIFCSVISRGSFASLVASYGLIGLIMFLCTSPSSWSPIIALTSLDSRLTTGHGSGFGAPVLADLSPTEVTLYQIGEYGFYHGFLSLIFLGTAIGNLRRTHRELPLETLIQQELARLPHQKPPPGDISHWFVRFRRSPVDDHPLWQREGNIPRGGWYDLFLLEIVTLTCCFVLITVVFLVGAIFTSSISDPKSLRAMNGVFRVMALLFLAGFCCLEAFRTASRITQEREQGTLESLLMLPEERQTLLRIKWLAGLWRFQGLFFAFFLYFLVGVISQAVHPLGAVLFLIAGAVHILFFASLGIWLSLVCRTTLQANLIMGCVIFSLTLLPFLILPPKLDSSDFLAMVNPAACWYHLCFSWEEFGHPQIWVRIGLALSGVLIYSGLTWLLWRWSCRRFCRDPLGNS